MAVPALTTTEATTMREQVDAAWTRVFPDTPVPASLLATESRITAVTLAERAHSGLLVALWLEPEQAAQLAVAGGEAPESLHLTLAYLADMADADDVTFARIVTALADVAAMEGVIEGKIGGAGCFYASDSSDGQDVYYATPDMPYLDFFRERVVRAIAHAGKYVDTERAFIPHITLAYGGAGADIPMPERIDLRFTGLTIVAGERRVTIPFYQPGENVDYVGAFPDTSMPVECYAEQTQIKPITGKATAAWRFSSRRTFTVGDDWIQVLPAPGTYHHSIYGTLDFTAAKYEQILSNFHTGVYAQQLPVNTEHDLMTSGAVGWVTDMRLGADGSIEVKTDWNERGRALLDGDRFRYVSAEWWDRWQHPVSGEWIDNVFSGFAICTRPHFKTDALRPLAASEVEAFRAGEPGKEMIGMTNPGAETGAPTGAVQLSEQELMAFREFQAAGGTARLTELSEAVTKLSEANQTLEADSRKKRFTDIARGRAEGADGVAWHGEVETHVSMLTDLATSFGDDSEQVKRYISVQTAQATALAEATKPLMQASGTNRGGDEAQGAWSQVEAKAKALRETKPELTMPQARTQVLSENPELRHQYRAETRSAVTGEE